MAVRQIYETARTEAEVKRRLRELIEYIKWKQGWQTMEAYEHYFDATRHADIQDALYQKMDETLRQSLVKQAGNKPQTLERQTSTEAYPMHLPHLIPDDPDFEFLRSIGGGSSGH